MSQITGYYGCKCHPFKDWSECEKAHRRKFKKGERVKQRCDTYHAAKEGTISKVMDQGFYVVKYGELPGDHELEHAANIQSIEKSGDNH